MTNIHFLQCVFLYLLIFSLPLSVTTAEVDHTLVLFFLVISELLSEQSCLGQ